ncbi:MAG: hypothetical protein J6S24_06435, partial [Lentisphaeria bacterium]|nr:hypothetical protein [Lentisphaeria bacterium]
PSVFSSRTAWLGFFQTIDKGCCSPFQGFATTPRPLPTSRKAEFFLFFLLALIGNRAFCFCRSDIFI